MRLVLVYISFSDKQDTSRGNFILALTALLVSREFDFIPAHAARKTVRETLRSRRRRRDKRVG